MPWTRLRSQDVTISSTTTSRLHHIHGFCASDRAFAAVVYLYTEYSNGDVDVQLVASKTRVAPLKRQTIPRLELLGALVLARLVDKVYQGFDYITSFTWGYIMDRFIYHSLLDPKFESMETIYPESSQRNQGTDIWVSLEALSRRVKSGRFTVKRMYRSRAERFNDRVERTSVFKVYSR